MTTKTITGTREWACTTFNICLGCPHGCLYCWACSNAVRFGWITAEGWKKQRILCDNLTLAGKGKPTKIMFPSTHDINPENLGFCLGALDKMLNRGHSVLIVSKPNVECIQAICERYTEFKEKILFRFTLGSLDKNVLRFWEPNAPSVEERLLSLELAHNNGYKTSISCEPMLDCHVEKVIIASLPFVTDSNWIGQMNQAKQRLKLNGAGQEALEKADKLLKSQSLAFIKNLYDQYKDNPRIKWKDSIKKMLGLDRPIKPGMDI